MQLFNSKKALMLTCSGLALFGLAVAVVLVTVTFGEEYRGEGNSVDGHWQLVSWHEAGKELVTDNSDPLSLKFDGQSISGNAGCNQFFGAYQPDKMAIGGVGSSRMLCASDKMRREQQFLAALKAAAKLSVDQAGQLHIDYAIRGMNSSMRFSRLPE